MLSRLKSFVSRRDAETCEICAQPLQGESERQVLDSEARRILVCCDACAHDQPAEARVPRYLRVERRAVRLPLQIGDASWADLGVPTALAYFSARRRSGEVVATFPGRRGLVEAFVPLKPWCELELAYPVLKGLLPEVEALLVRRNLRHQDYFQVSIDHCYELAHLIRQVGPAAALAEHDAVHEFFSRIDAPALSGQRVRVV